MRRYCREHYTWYWIQCPICKRERYVERKLGRVGKCQK